MLFLVRYNIKVRWYSAIVFIKQHLPAICMVYRSSSNYVQSSLFYSNVYGAFPFFSLGGCLCRFQLFNLGALCIIWLAMHGTGRRTTPRRLCCSDGLNDFYLFFFLSFLWSQNISLCFRSWQIAASVPRAVPFLFASKRTQ
jgi:hypothetical protein